MVTADTRSHLECPVCHEGFNEPKILPCAHLVCRECLLFWLEKGGYNNGCPLCQGPILPEPESSEDQIDLALRVDALPTDKATAVMVKMQRTLSDQHVCGCCKDAEASLFCLKCFIKLCNACAKIHARIPSSQDHVTVNLSDLTAEQLAMHHWTPCSQHGDKQVELYCPKHKEMICLLCVTSTHRECSKSVLEGIGFVASAKREELRELVRRLKDKEKTVTDTIRSLKGETSAAQAKFKAMKDEVKASFGDMQASVEAEQLKLNASIQARSDAYLAALKASRLEFKHLQGILSAHIGKAEQLAHSATDSCLLDMLEDLLAHLRTLESQTLPGYPSSTAGHLSLRRATLEKANNAVAVIAVLQDSEEDYRPSDKCLMCGRCLEGQEFADRIKTGDRVRRGRDWQHGSQDGLPPGAGTVTHVASNLTTGYVTVKWDCGNWRSGYRMGVDNCYELKFVFD